MAFESIVSKTTLKGSSDKLSKKKVKGIYCFFFFPTSLVVKRKHGGKNWWN